MEVLDEMPGQELEYAGFGTRVIAYLIDSVLIAVVGGLTGFLFGWNIFEGGREIIWFNNILFMLYFIVMEGGNQNATFGKRLVGIRVTDMQGAPIGYEKAVIRNIGKILSAFVLLIGFIMVMFTERKQGLHDLIAKTLVLHN